MPVHIVSLVMLATCQGIYTTMVYGVVNFTKYVACVENYATVSGNELWISFNHASSECCEPNKITLDPTDIMISVNILLTVLTEWIHYRGETGDKWGIMLCFLNVPACSLLNSCLRVLCSTRIASFNKMIESVTDSFLFKFSSRRLLFITVTDMLKIAISVMDKVLLQLRKRQSWNS